MSQDSKDSKGTDNLQGLRTHIFDAIRSVRDGTLDLDRARVINDLCKTANDTARTEVDFLRTTGGDQSQFLGPQAPGPQPSGAQPNGITGIVQHRLRG
jgi:hypothetical protein